MNERDIVRLPPNFLLTVTNSSPQITRGIHTDCLLNYETVKYFSGEEHEGERYRNAIHEYQALEYKVMSTSITQSSPLLCPLTASSFPEPVKPCSEFHHRE